MTDIFSSTFNRLYTFTKSNELNCKICGDRSSGKHYGAISCDGCRGFFKRSSRRNKRYVCKANNRCEINVYSRNNCQSCRLKACLIAGMRTDIVIKPYRFNEAKLSIPRATSEKLILPKKTLHNIPNQIYRTIKVDETIHEDLRFKNNQIHQTTNNMNWNDIVLRFSKLLANVDEWIKNFPHYSASYDSTKISNSTWVKIFILILAENHFPIEDMLFSVNFPVNKIDSDSFRFGSNIICSCVKIIKNSRIDYVGYSYLRASVILLEVYNKSFDRFQFIIESIIKEAKDYNLKTEPYSLINNLLLMPEIDYHVVPLIENIKNLMFK